MKHILAIALVYSFLFLLLSTQAKAADTTPPTIIDSNPNGVLISNTINLSATTDENAICKYDTLNLIFVDMANTFSGTSTSHEEVLTLPDDDYIYYIRCKDLSDNIMTNTKIVSFSIDSTNGGDRAPPSILDHSPKGTTSGYEHTLRTITNEEATCKFSETDDTYAVMPYTFSGTIEHTYNLGLTDGSYHYFVKCKDASNNTMNEPYEIEFSVDNDPPVILSYTPDSSETRSFEMQVTTNKQSTCKYSSLPGLSYDSMESIFTTTGYSIHRTPLTFDNDGFQTLYVKCKDSAGNIQDEDYVITIDVDVPPTAQITLSEESPIKPGTIYVTLIASEALVISPKVSYLLYDQSGSSTTFTVPLQGFGQVWTGYMIIPEGESKRIGAFEFEGTDFGGNKGTIVTSGNAFIVDSTIPDKIETLKAISVSDGSIKLNWEYENDEDIEKYNIYRSLTSDVDPLDYYDESSNKKYVDEDTQNNTVYYYKIAPVDTANNRGLLSRAIEGTSIWEYGNDGTSYTTSTTQTSAGSQTLKSNLIPLVDKAISDANHIDVMISNAGTYYIGQQDNEFVSKIGFQKTVTEARTSFNNYINQLNALKSKDIDQATLEEEIKKIELRILSLKKEIVVRVDTKEEREISTNSGLSDINNGISYLMNLLRMIDLDDTYKNSLQKASAKISEAYSVSGTATIITATYADGSSKDFLYIKKEITPITDSLPNEEGVIVIEDIPPEIANDVKEVHFITPGSEIMKADTVVKWDLGTLDGTIEYYVTGSFSELNEIIIPSIFLDNYKLYFNINGDESKSSAGNFLTGNVIAKSIQGLGAMKDKIGIILGILAVLALGVYYFTMDASKGINQNNTSNNQNNNNNNNNSIHNIAKRTNSKIASLWQKKNYNQESNNKYNNSENNLHYSPTKYESNAFSHKEIVSPNAFFESKEQEMKQNQNEIEEQYSSELKKAHNLIDNMSFHDANMHYFSLLNSLQSEKVDETKKQQLYEELDSLHKKLSLYMTIHEANINFKKTDKVALISNLNAISDMYNSIAKEHELDSKLMQNARESHEQFRSIISEN